MKSKLFYGHVYHKRFTPHVHEFKYRSFFMQISLKEINSFKLKFFSINHFNLFSFDFKDHGKRNSSDLYSFANQLLETHNFSADYDDIVIHTIPRIFGYIFNPVSFWYVIKNNQTVAIIAEVNNTFGETKSYVLDPNIPASIKAMQVSPFNQIEGNYQFSFQSKNEYSKVHITYLIENSPVIYASTEGKEIPFNDFELLKLFFKLPIHNLMIVSLIHFEALRLFIKKVPFYGKNGAIQ